MEDKITIEPFDYGDKFCLRGVVDGYPRLIITDTREELEQWVEDNA